MKATLIIALLLCIPLALVGAQSDVPVELADGLRAFQAGELERALDEFEAALERDDIPAWRGHALFWAARTQMARGRYAAAADFFDTFLARFDAHPYREESLYQRARLFFIKEEYETAVQRFSAFIDSYPQSAFYPNALYWSGEALFELGRLDEAERLFAEVTDHYPSSFRVDAARYRLDVIELARRENELLRLLQWSHEEYLSALETFQQRERSYQEALRSYRDRLAGLATEDFRAEIAGLNARVEELEARVSERDERINELLAQLRQASASGGPGGTGSQTPAQTPAPITNAGAASSPEADLELRETLLSLKAQALELQEILLDEQEETQ
ncbi:MAG: tetratricopeptide repeat protein [Spirochaetota bacterium]